MQDKRFQKRVEGFSCEKCGTYIKDTGYTDHCQNCLWSKHVDVNPGDRKANCGGIMEPIGVTTKKSEYVINCRCTKCGYRFRAKAANNDNFEEILKLVSKPFLP